MHASSHLTAIPPDLWRCFSLLIFYYPLLILYFPPVILYYPSYYPLTILHIPPHTFFLSPYISIPVAYHVSILSLLLPAYAHSVALRCPNSPQLWPMLLLLSSLSSLYSGSVGQILEPCCPSCFGKPTPCRGLADPSEVFFFIFSPPCEYCSCLVVPRGYPYSIFPNTGSPGRRKLQ